jgi:selenophosphate synthetase-related protein
MLKQLAKSIRNNVNITEKRALNPIINLVRTNSFVSRRIFSDYGEDSASIEENEKLILFTTDGIRTEFVKNFPYGAGFSAIMVSADDIYACGGFPIAASLVVSYADENIGKEIFRGICEGSQKFHIPIIRGHTDSNSDIYSLAISLIGEIPKNDYISARNAQIGDDILLIVDFNGKPGKASKYYWDTATFKSSEEILFIRRSMNEIAKKHLLNSAKDISNGGIFGTLYQLIEYSELGAKIDVDSIIIPEKLKKLKYSLEDYANMYLNTSFIITCN